ncbi:glycosyltransferase family 1 protein [uncultured Thiodictyon sp.]|uniref:glycosyltransferase family 4 protein n=1 Tax=uncultured Thiodictyon sp. TaxID=1846217 RepID=UPI0025CF4547|nr:glycosyltransferase family 1 protein [uncultured Thiodictyon sp.]
MQPLPRILTDSLRPDRLDIAIVTETYPPEINGVANTMRYLAQGLSQRGHRILLIRPRQRTEPPQPEAIAIVHFPVPGLPLPGYRGLRFGLPVYWRLRRLWCRVTPTLIYIATQGPLGHAALAAARALNIPTVTGFHTQFHQYSQHYGLALLTRPITAALRHFHNRSDVTLVPTAALQGQLSTAGFRNVQVFGRGVDVARFSPAWRDPQLRRSWGCDEETLVVLFVGRLAAEKNLTLARATFRAILAERPEARFVLVGDGPERERLRRECPEFICPGAKVGEELSAHYACGDLFLFPSLTETFGNVVTEAMASGLPVIAFDDAAAHTYIAPWQNGVTVPVGDGAAFIAASRQLAGDGARLRQMGQAARRTAEGIRWDPVLGTLEERLHEVLRRRRATAAGQRSPVLASAQCPRYPER